MRDKLYKDMIAARKDKNKELLSTLTLAWNEVTSTEKTEKIEKLPDARFIAIMNKLIKQDKETLEGFEKRETRKIWRRWERESPYINLTYPSS